MLLLLLLLSLYAFLYPNTFPNNISFSISYYYILFLIIHFVKQKMSGEINAHTGMISLTNWNVWISKLFLTILRCMEKRQLLMLAHVWELFQAVSYFTVCFLFLLFLLLNLLYFKQTPITMVCNQMFVVIS